MPATETELITLLQTKLYMPRVMDDLIQRPRLVCWLGRALACRLTLVCAPGGFGKATLLASGWVPATSPLHGSHQTMMTAILPPS